MRIASAAQEARGLPPSSRPRSPGAESSRARRTRSRDLSTSSLCSQSTSAFTAPMPSEPSEPSSQPSFAALSAACARPNSATSLAAAMRPTPGISGAIWEPSPHSASWWMRCSTVACASHLVTQVSGVSGGRPSCLLGRGWAATAGFGELWSAGDGGGTGGCEGEGEAQRRTPGSKPRSALYSSCSRRRCIVAATHLTMDCVSFWA
mmetsp:Transcript_93193/g.301294  ORF Transcript_93193/g.301294 Transcript_93193/m.301294 type:complete len:206 (-) Transcript_93193:1687-2304(-)